MQYCCFFFGTGSDSLVLEPLIEESNKTAKDCSNYGSSGVGNGSCRSADDGFTGVLKDAEPIDGQDLVPLQSDLQGGMSFIYVKKQEKIVFKFPYDVQEKHELMTFKENSLKKELLILQLLKQETDKPGYFIDFLGVVTWKGCFGLKLKKYSGDARTFFSYIGSKPDHVILMLKHVIIALCYFHDTIKHAHLDIKQENIFVECSGDKHIFKLADFGLALPLEPKVRISSYHRVPSELRCDTKHKIDLAKLDYYYLGNMLARILEAKKTQNGWCSEAIFVPLTQFSDLLVKKQQSDRPADSKTLICFFNEKLCTKPSATEYLKISPQ